MEYLRIQQNTQIDTEKVQNSTQFLKIEKVNGIIDYYLINLMKMLLNL